MEKIASNSFAEYRSALFTSNPFKIGFLLNDVIHNPDSAILVEPVKNEYWIFYTGDASFPEEKHNDIKHFQAEKIQNEVLSINDNSVDTGQWLSEMVKIEPGEFFVPTICAAINKIKNKNSIRIAIEQGEGFNRKLYFYYKK
ncbi:hypothetical protein [Flavobacterium anhuiense]|uniref:Uncharacterized protein n=1 Tax=Flavobacterium anhuiense TaxID=459526 RepID=A0ABY0LYA6_9FLAO|nr:hypothetical protein [Flavobacterium anhuiense]SCY78772.1 hypothetical protein SAMN02927916_3388 [Flavobacterium anhuiense]